MWLDVACPGYSAKPYLVLRIENCHGKLTHYNASPAVTPAGRQQWPPSESVSAGIRAEDGGARPFAPEIQQPLRLWRSLTASARCRRRVLRCE